MDGWRSFRMAFWTVGGPSIRVESLDQTICRNGFSTPLCFGLTSSHAASSTLLWRASLFKMCNRISHLKTIAVVLCHGHRHPTPYFFRTQWICRMQTPSRSFGNEGEKRSPVFYLCQFYHCGGRLSTLSGTCFLAQVKRHDSYQAQFCFWFISFSLLSSDSHSILLLFFLGKVTLQKGLN